MDQLQIYSLLEIEMMAASYSGTIFDFRHDLNYYFAKSKKRINKIAKSLNIYPGEPWNVSHYVIAHLVGGDPSIYFYSSYN